MRSKRFTILVAVLMLFAATLALAGPVTAAPGTTTIFQIGDFEGPGIPAGYDEFSQTGWETTSSHTVVVTTPVVDSSTVPAGIISAALDAAGTAPHDARGVPELVISFSLADDYIDAELTLAKYGVESDFVVIDVDGDDFTVPGAGEGVWNETDLDLGTLAAGPHTITIMLAGVPAPQGNEAHVWDALKLTGDQVPQGTITSPGAGETLLVGDLLYVGASYLDDDPGGVQWAVRNGTCAAGTNTVAGNVDGFSTPYSWDGASFSAMIDTYGWDSGDFCFVFNPREDGNEPDMRLTREFRIADGYVAGGGQLIEDVDDRKKPFKVSFGGELWRFGSDTECEWTVQFHDVSVEAVTKGTFHGTMCTAPADYPDGGADGVTNFTVRGTFNGEIEYRVVMRLEDYSEPADGGLYMSDTVRFELWGPTGKIYDTSDKFFPGGDFTSTSDNSGTARTELDNGNLQIDLR